MRELFTHIRLCCLMLVLSVAPAALAETYTSIADTKAAITDTDAEATLSFDEVLVQYVNGSYTYISTTDGTEGLLLYGKSLGLTAGQIGKLEVSTCTLMQYNNLPEVKVSSSNITFTESSSENSPVIQTVDLATIESSYADYMNEYVSVKVQMGAEAFSKNSKGYYTSMALNGSAVQLYSKGWTDIEESYDTSVTYAVTGFVCIFNESVQIYPISITKVLDGTYYIYNVDEDLYLTNGNDWGTHAVGEVLTQGDAFQWTAVSQDDGTYTLHQLTQPEGKTLYGDCWVDGAGTWTIVEGDESVAIKSGDSFLGMKGYSHALLTTEGTATEWKLVPVDGIDDFVTETELAKSIAKATELGLTDAVSTAEAAEDKAEALKTLNAAIFESVTAEATSDNPVDVSYLGRNLSFESSKISGVWQEKPAAWTQTTIIKHAGNYRVFESATGVVVYENWAGNAYTGKISQTITELPAGFYKVEMAGFAGTPANAKVYANSASTALTTNNSAAPEAVETEKVYVAEGGSLEFGLNVATAMNWVGFQYAKVYYLGNDLSELATAYEEALAAAKAEDEADEDMTTDAATALDEAIANYGDVDKTDGSALAEAIEALSNATADAKTSAEAYASAKDALDAMKAEMDNTNVYTAEAYETFNNAYGDWLAAYEAGTLSDTEATGIYGTVFGTGWRSANTVDDFLLSAWSIGDTKCSNYDASLYINTWSVEGNTDGSEVKTPFFEYWTGDANSLGANTLTATMTNLEAGDYTVTALVRVRLNNTAAATEGTTPQGISLTVNDGEAVDVCAGTQSTTEGLTQMYYATYSAKGTVGDDGTLTITFNVAEDNNVSWIAFKNVYFEIEPTEQAMNLDFEICLPVENGICTYAKDCEKNGTTLSGMQPVDGWTASNPSTDDARAAGVFTFGSEYFLGGAGYTAPAEGYTATSDDSGIKARKAISLEQNQALGLVAVWTAKMQYTAAQTLEAGNYKVEIPVYNAGGETAFTKNLIGFVEEDGTEHLATTTSYAVGEWTLETISFTLEEKTTGYFTVGYEAANAGSDAMPHLFIDYLDYYTVSDEDAAREALAAAIAAANEKNDETADLVGDGLFLYPEDALNTHNDAIEAAQAVYDNADATQEEIDAATETMLAATETYAASQTAPTEATPYAIQQKTSNLYLTIGEGITIESSVDSLFFEPVGDGTYYISNGTEYVCHAGTNNWTMSATGTQIAFTIVPVKDGESFYYQLQWLNTGKNANCVVGTDATDAGSACYDDKTGTDDTKLWTISEVTEEMVGIEGVTIDGALLASPKNIYSVSGTLVKQNATTLEGLQKGIYIVNGKKVLVK